MVENCSVDQANLGYRQTLFQKQKQNKAQIF